MYTDLIVLAVLVVFVIIYSKRLQTYFYGFGVIDCTFRILNIIKGYIPNKNAKIFINTYIPESVPGVINKYTSDAVNTILTLLYVIIMAIFLFYIIKLFIKRKKI